MATQNPISALDALGGPPASGDLLVLVDISDSTQSPQGSTKKMTTANLFTSPTFTGTLTAAALATTGAATFGSTVTVAAVGAGVTVNATSGDPSLLFQKAGVQQGGWKMTALSTMNLLDNGGATVAAFTGGALNITGAFSVATNKVTIASATGNTVIAGTLDVTGDFKVNTNKFIVTASSGAVTAASLAVTAGLTSSGPTGAGIGYATGAGSAVTQITSRSTAVTINTLCGKITTDTTSLGVGAQTSFVVNNSTVAIGDTVLLTIENVGIGISIISVTAIANGAFTIRTYNASTSTAETTAFIINFTVIKSVSA